MERIEVVYFQAGGGHRAAAHALQEVCARQHRRWEVKPVDLFRLLDSGGRFAAVTGRQPEDFYNARLASGRTFGMRAELRLLQQAIRAGSPWIRARMAAHWQASCPDLMVSAVPNFNRPLRQALADCRPNATYVTMMTDMADLPPRFWVERGLDQHVICGTPGAARQARQAGLRLEQISLTSGMPLRPSFHDDPDEAPQRHAARVALGLDPSQFTGVVLFGGHGSRQMLEIAQALDDVQLIFLCGHQAGLAAQLRACRRQAAHAVLEFTPEVARVLRVADFFIGKPGPGSLSEAVQCGLPVITFHNRSTMPQEVSCLRWVREHDLGLILTSVRELPVAVQAMRRQHGEWSSRVRAVRNRAIFEIPEILDALLRTRRAQMHVGSKSEVDESTESAVLP
jgi:1,2-diacylglycerol 3-beta-galactosyltransferase